MFGFLSFFFFSSYQWQHFDGKSFKKTNKRIKATNETIQRLFGVFFLQQKWAWWEKINEFERKSGKKKSPFLLCTKQKKKNPDGNDNLRDVKKKKKKSEKTIGGGGGLYNIATFFFSLSNKRGKRRDTCFARKGKQKRQRSCHNQRRNKYNRKKKKITII